MPNYIFDWDSVFAAGSSPSQTLYGPVDFTFATSGSAGLTTQSVLVNNTQVLGGVSTGYLRVAMNASAPGQSITQTINFNNTSLPTTGVTNVQFDILDIDQSLWDDQVTIIAYDAAGNPLPATAVSITAADPVNGPTVTGNVVNGSANVTDSNITGNVSVTIAQEVSRVDIVYEAGPDFASNPAIQVIGIGPITYDAVGIFDDRGDENPTPTDQADDGIITGTAGNDVIFGGLTTDGGLTAGGTSGADADASNPNDVINAGAGDDTIYSGVGADSYVLDDGFGNDNAADFNQPGGDRVDTSSMSDPGATGYNTTGIDTRDFDLTDAADNGDGTTTITFPGGETMTLPSSNIDLTTVATLRQSLLNIGIPCFTRGVMIATPAGEVAVEDLKVGDLVETRDHGAQSIRWIGKRTMPAVGSFAPITIKSGALDNDRDLTVSPQHRMLIEGWKAEVMFAEDEVLVAAKHLTNGDTIFRSEGGEVEYFHILFDQHEIVMSNGAPSESFHPGEVTLSSMDETSREEIITIFPELRDNVETGYSASARMTLKKYEVDVMLALDS